MVEGADRGKRSEGHDNQGEIRQPRRNELTTQELTFDRARGIHERSQTAVTYTSHFHVITDEQAWGAPRKEGVFFAVESSDAAVPKSIERTKFIGDSTKPIDRVYIFDGKIRRETVDAASVRVEEELDALVTDPLENHLRLTESLHGILDDLAIRVETGFDLMGDGEVLMYLRRLKDTLPKKNWPKEISLPETLGEKGDPAPETVELFNNVVDSLARSSGQKQLHSTWTEDAKLYELRTTVQKNGGVEEVALIATSDETANDGFVERTIDSWKFYSSGSPFYLNEYDAQTQTDNETDVWEFPSQLAPMLADKKFNFDVVPSNTVASPSQSKLGLRALEKRYRGLINEETVQESTQSEITLYDPKTPPLSEGSSDMPPQPPLWTNPEESGEEN